MVSIVQNTASKDIRTIIECFVFEAVLSQGWWERFSKFVDFELVHM